MRLLILLLCCAASAFADIGDTEQQVMKSIGKAPFASVYNGNGSYLFFFRDTDGMERGCFLLDRKCCVEIFTATREQTQGILSKYGEWELGRSGEKPIWKLKNSNLVARYQRDNGSLMIGELDKFERLGAAMGACLDWFKGLKPFPFR